MNKEQARLIFGTRLNYSPEAVLHNILACQEEIKKHQKKSGMWQVYFKELRLLHALKKYQEEILNQEL